MACDGLFEAHGGSVSWINKMVLELWFSLSLSLTNICTILFTKCGYVGVWNPEAVQPQLQINCNKRMDPRTTPQPLLLFYRSSSVSVCMFLSSIMCGKKIRVMQQHRWRVSVIKNQRFLEDSDRATRFTSSTRNRIQIIELH